MLCGAGERTLAIAAARATASLACGSMRVQTAMGARWRLC